MRWLFNSQICLIRPLTGAIKIKPLADQLSLFGRQRMFFSLGKMALFELFLLALRDIHTYKPTMT